MGGDSSYIREGNGGGGVPPPIEEGNGGDPPYREGNGGEPLQLWRGMEGLII